tara:strand:- start:521 stop:1060 length:540 start_codon:yes stop_codon:yes gene_type:complete
MPRRNKRIYSNKRGGAAVALGQQMLQLAQNKGTEEMAAKAQEMIKTMKEAASNKEDEDKDATSAMTEAMERMEGMIPMLGDKFKEAFGVAGVDEIRRKVEENRNNMEENKKNMEENSERIKSLIEKVEGLLNKFTSGGGTRSKSFSSKKRKKSRKKTRKKTKKRKKSKKSRKKRSKRNM